MIIDEKKMQEIPHYTAFEKVRQNFRNTRIAITPVSTNKNKGNAKNTQSCRNIENTLETITNAKEMQKKQRTN